MPTTGYAEWQGNVAINITAMKVVAAAVKSKRKFAETVQDCTAQHSRA